MFAPSRLLQRITVSSPTSPLPTSPPPSLSHPLTPFFSIATTTTTTTTATTTATTTPFSFVRRTFQSSATTSCEAKNLPAGVRGGVLSEDEYDALPDDAPQFPGGPSVPIRKVETPSNEPIDLGDTPAVLEERAGFAAIKELDDVTTRFDVETVVAKAHKHLFYALELNPHPVQRANIHYGITKGYQRLMDWKNCLKHGKKALYHDENFVPVYEVMGEACMMTSQWKKALGWFSKFFDTFPEYYSAFGEYSKELNSEHILAGVLFKRGVCYFNIHDYVCAAGDWNGVIELGGPHVDKAYSWLGKIAFGRARYHESLAMLNKAIEINPESIKAYSDRSMVHDILGKTKEADDDRRQFNLLRSKLIWKRF
eukprot:TRINITY_DN1195_c0_g1_i1.p1 TRINITY_DN1195_c0_g1~~TRINITY_DN1195_c0_g1_i1.p1  ORF type:complete len:383 (+),score=95.95 TRINITY_DN1195_c0_g1_i1:48-1151(+)